VALTAWDTQKIKLLAAQVRDETSAGRVAVLGALTLYLDFINLFIYLLRILGVRRD
jgi:FtsH-binding integral membrane protein